MPQQFNSAHRWLQQITEGDFYCHKNSGSNRSFLLVAWLHRTGWGCAIEAGEHPEPGFGEALFKSNYFFLFLNIA